MWLKYTCNSESLNDKNMRNFCIHYIAKHIAEIIQPREDGHLHDMFQSLPKQARDEILLIYHKMQLKMSGKAGLGSWSCSCERRFHWSSYRSWRFGQTGINLHFDMIFLVICQIVAHLQQISSLRICNIQFQSASSTTILHKRERTLQILKSACIVMTL